ncbi:MAG: molybdopterin oxidoreductase family protein [Betaproteobacteria bacterium]|jgi:anaerobic selenocysteine-containing dehydrogenase|nr:molybdopterin oxidoreductase family protein [Betaproteobacteria bacterium]
MNAPDSIGRKIVQLACPHDCPDTCAMDVTVEDGVAVEIKGGDMPFTAGVLCTKVAKYLERTYSPERVLHPLKRVGRKGEGRFERISWDEALDTIAARFKAIAAEDPQQILPSSYAGNMGLINFGAMDRRFFNRLGASHLDRTLCSTAGKAGMKITLGGSVGTNVEHAVDAKLILIWGSNPIVSNLHFWTRCQEAKRRGAKLVIIDPRRNETAEKCHEHIALLPGTDGALALAMMHVIIGENRHDRDYVERHTVGFDRLAARVKDWTPERAAAVCGITPDQIVALAREYATVKPALIRLNYGMQRCHGGGMAVRAIACLPALVGAWRSPAGGVVLSTSGFYGLNHHALERPDLISGAPRTINHAALGDALTAAQPPVKAIYVYNNNPVAVCPDSRKVIAGFSREDLFCVVHDLFLTDTADYADIVLPATSQLEHHDIHSSYGHLYVLASQPAIAPVGESKPNAEVFRLLAKRMGFDDPCFDDTDEDLCRQALESSSPTLVGIGWDGLKAAGWKRLTVADAPFANGGFPTPSGKCEFYSEWAAKQGLDPLPTYVAPYEGPTSNPELANRYPLAFISPPNRHFLNSSFANLEFARKDAGEPTLEMHPDDAAPRGISDGALVRIANDRGEFSAVARLNGRARRGVVIAPSVWWRKLSPDGCNANEVTSQALADLRGAATFYDCLVEVIAA